MERAVDHVRESYWTDPLVSNAEYGRLIEEADEDDERRLAEAERRDWEREQEAEAGADVPLSEMHSAGTQKFQP